MKGLLLLYIFLPCFTSAQLKCAPIFSDNMVFQRDAPVSIWGKGTPGKSVRVKLGTAVATVTVKTDSSWRVTFQPQSANKKPLDVAITSGEEKFIIKNVLMGDVWICLGQSNMEWPMQLEAHYETEIPNSYQPLLRIYNPDYAGKDIYSDPFSEAVMQELKAGNFYKGKWEPTDSITFKKMSAVAYYFGKEIVQETSVPVGLVHLAIGGAPIETFISGEAMQKNPRFQNKLQGNWLYNQTLPVWVRERGLQNTAKYAAELKMEDGPNHPYKPGYAFENGIRPLLDLPIKGVLWYQGESNAQEYERVSEYTDLMKLMVYDYRLQWKQPQLPFYFVQLSSIDTTTYNGKLWPLFRDEQRKAMQEIHHSGMVVTTDAGAKNDVHPRDKKTVGLRLARWALKNEYHKKITASGPLPVNAILQNDTMLINFQHTGASLRAANGEVLKGFSLDGVNDIEASARQQMVVIRTNKWYDSLYYGWKPFTDANLVNEVGLPASTFKIAVKEMPSLLPLPVQLRWTRAQFSLDKCKTIFINDPAIRSTALALQQELVKIGWKVSLKETIPKGQHYIALRFTNVDAPQLKEEAYHVRVQQDQVVLSANTPKGMFHALQTLLQLIQDKTTIQGCEITDWPAFAWRGYMIDVGRNFMSMELLKQQIDVMSRYKLNIFHFHFTEDIAWRLESKRYPHLTSAQFMLRNKGSCYSEADMHALIKYCRERYITLVPEIDMPGHSAAFTRAMGFNMQTDSGMAIVKNILDEFIATYDLPYFHIGADEVKITNTNFVPEITALIERRGKKVIGWQPGGNFTNSTIRQLWMDDNAHLADGKNIQYVDSRHLYINHMDPLESVVTIFHRKIADKDRGDHNALGATLCMWHDRAVAHEEDILRMNPVYPSMLAFAERTWRGGGLEGWTTVIGAPGSENEKDFSNFENRLLDHQQQYFTALPFPYVKQSTTKWKLYGPYFNNGNLTKEFAPETNPETLIPALEIIGGTIVLRHWWHPLVSGALEQSDDSTTWYATTKIFSEKETSKNFWIGFNNLSRSPATDPPPLGAWDTKKSSVWVNGILIEPPVWKRGGQKGHSEIPLIDEGYEYRPPTKISMKKGWNNVLIKIPVATFNGKDWQNPVKWMFTFAEVP